MNVNESAHLPNKLHYYLLTDYYDFVARLSETSESGRQWKQEQGQVSFEGWRRQNSGKD